MKNLGLSLAITALVVIVRACGSDDPWTPAAEDLGVEAGPSDLSPPRDQGLEPEDAGDEGTRRDLGGDRDQGGVLADAERDATALGDAKPSDAQGQDLSSSDLGVDLDPRDQGPGRDAARRDLGPGDQGAPDLGPPPEPGPPIGDSLCISNLPGSGAKQALAIQKMQEAGVHWGRDEVPWHRAEPRPGEWSWAAADSRVNPYLESGIDLIVVLAYGNPWASSREGADAFFPPDDPEDFGRYVRRMVTRYGERVQRWEVWNEPNAGYRFWKPGPNGDPAAYGRLLLAAVAAGREVCPGCSFAFGAPFFHEQLITGHLGFLRQAHEGLEGLAGSWDAMGLHPYPLYPPQAPPEGPPPEDEWSFLRMVTELRAVMDELGGEGRPIWVTEMGWPVYNRVDPPRQAAYLLRGHLHLLGQGVTPICWYTLFDGPDPGSFPPEDDFGLFSWAQDEGGARVAVPKPSYATLRLLGTRFAQHRILRALVPGEDIPRGAHGYELVGPEEGERWWALWTHPAEGPARVALPAPPVEVLDAQGVGLELPGEPSLPGVGWSPLFVRF